MKGVRGLCCTGGRGGHTTSKAEIRPSFETPIIARGANCNVCVTPTSADGNCPRTAWSFRSQDNLEEGEQNAWCKISRTTLSIHHIFRSFACQPVVASEPPSVGSRSSRSPVTSLPVTAACSWPSTARLALRPPPEFAKLHPFTMYHDMEGDLIRAYQLLMELSEQNNHNYKMSGSLHGLTDTLKVNLCAFLSLARSNPSELKSA